MEVENKMRYKENSSFMGIYGYFLDMGYMFNFFTLRVYTGIIWVYFKYMGN